jgi:hypothetical protein
MTMDMGAPSQTCWFSGVPRHSHHLIPPPPPKKKHTFSHTHTSTDFASQMLQRKPNYVQPSKQSQSERASERADSIAGEMGWPRKRWWWWNVPFERDKRWRKVAKSGVGSKYSTRFLFCQMPWEFIFLRFHSCTRGYLFQQTTWLDLVYNIPYSNQT